MIECTKLAYDTARRLYEENDRIGVPFQDRTQTIQEAWVATAKLKIASGDALATISTDVAH